MAILEFIFGKSKKLENKFFGKMLFFEDKKDSNKNYFECKRHFSPSNRTIEIGMNGESIGPTQKQIDFF